MADFFYKHQLKKFADKKTPLTTNIAKFGDVLSQEHRQLKTMDDSDLTTFPGLVFKPMGKRIRADKSTGREFPGSDTRYRLRCTSSRGEPGAKSTKKAGKKRKSDEVVPREQQLDEVPRRSRRQPVSYREEEGSSEGVAEEEDSDGSTNNGQNESDGNDAASRSDEDNGNAGRTSGGSGGEGEGDEGDGDLPPGFYEDLCAELTAKNEARKELIKSLKQQLAQEQELRGSLEQQVRDLQQRLSSYE